MQITHSSQDITQWFFGMLTKLLDSRAIVTVGLAGGSSFDEWYSDLLKISEWDTIDTSRIRWCVTDERVNCDLTERNDTHIWEVFLSHMCEKGWSEEQYFIRPRIDSKGPDYTDMVGDIDMAFFGIGTDGHTASLFPHHLSLTREEHGFIKIENAPKLPPERISLSPKSIGGLAHVCLFVIGAQKKEALANFLDDTVSIDDCPAKLLKPEILFDSTTN